MQYFFFKYEVCRNYILSLLNIIHYLKNNLFIYVMCGIFGYISNNLILSKLLSSAISLNPVIFMIPFPVWVKPCRTINKGYSDVAFQLFGT